MRTFIIAAAAAALLAGCSSSSNKPAATPSAVPSTAPPTLAPPSASIQASVAPTTVAAPTSRTALVPAVPQQFTVTESAYNLMPQPGGMGKYYVEWVVVLNNPNSALYGLFPVVTVTARDDSGVVLGTQDQTLSDLPPGTTIAFAGQIDATAQPSKVEFTPGKVQWQPTKTTATDYKPFTVANLTIKPDPIYGYVVSGDVANPYGQGVDLAVTALLRDDAGKLVGRHTAFVNGVAANGSHPFSAETGKTATPATRADVLAMPWGGVTWNKLATAQ